MEQLVYKIADKEYLLIDYLTNNNAGIDTCNRLIKRYNCLLQGGRKQGGFLNQTINWSVLVPVENAIAFNSDMLKF